MSSSSPSSSLNPTTLSLHSKLHHHHHLHPPSSLTFPASKPSSLCLFPNAHHRQLRVLSASPGGSPDYDLEESRWLREEQRWLREEQRWLREEQRWARERESLLGEIARLKLRVQALEREVQIPGGDPGEVVSVAALLQVSRERNLIAESGTSASPIVLEEKKEEAVEEKEIVVKEKVVGVSKDETKEEENQSEKKEKMKMRRALRVGAEGDEVRAMQEALQKMGFYSGEEDMEFSSFSSGTERAVKTWQASVGVKEDGVMTVELLEMLYFGKEDGGNGAAALSVMEMLETQRKVVNQSDSEVEVSQHRVFLLGENRWEEPQRLSGRNRKASESKSGNTTTRCLACRGEGHLMCTECDGTGQPNIEEQFMEWIDEGAKCPYCEGLGHTICDVCEGKTVA